MRFEIDVDRYLEQERIRYENTLSPYPDYDFFCWNEREKKAWLESLKKDLRNNCKNILDLIHNYCFDCKYIVKNGVFEGVNILVDPDQGDEKGYILSTSNEGCIYYELDVPDKDYFCTSALIDDKINTSIFEFFSYCYKNNITCEYLKSM